MELPELQANLLEHLAAHEKRSQWRYEELCKKVHETSTMPHGAKEQEMEGLNSDRVNINLGEGGGGGSGGMAAVIAALGQRNQGSDNAALIAALGQRNESRRNDDGFGMGGGGILGTIALLGLLRGRGGLGGGDDDCGSGGKLAILQTLMENGADLRAAIPTAALETQKEVCRSTGEITNAVNQSQLASLAAFSNLKDAVTNTGTILLGSGNQNTKEILQAICALSGKIDNNQILDLQRQLGVAQAAAAEERGHRHSDAVEVKVSQQVTQAQAQAQQQAQLNGLFGALNNLANDLQLVKQGQTIFNSGTMAASGTQAAANTRVN